MEACTCTTSITSLRFLSSFDPLDGGTVVPYSMTVQRPPQCHVEFIPGVAFGVDAGASSGRNALNILHRPAVVVGWPLMRVAQIQRGLAFESESKKERDG